MTDIQLNKRQAHTFLRILEESEELRHAAFALARDLSDPIEIAQALLDACNGGIITDPHQKVLIRQALSLATRPTFDPLAQNARDFNTARTHDPHEPPDFNIEVKLGGSSVANDERYERKVDLGALRRKVKREFPKVDV